MEMYMEQGIIDDLIAYQKAIIVNPSDSGDLLVTLDADIPDYVSASREGKAADLTLSPVTYRIDRGEGFGGDKDAYARQAVWYGRKGGKFKYPIKRTEPPSLAPGPNQDAAGPA